MTINPTPTLNFLPNNFLLKKDVNFFASVLCNSYPKSLTNFNTYNTFQF